MSPEVRSNQSQVPLEEIGSKCPRELPKLEEPSDHPVRIGRRQRKAKFRWNALNLAKVIAQICNYPEESFTSVVYV